MCLDIKSDRIGLAVASHTLSDDLVEQRNVLAYKSRPRTQKEVNHQIIQSIKDYTKHQKIDGFLINWPLESDGRFGKQCGKVLHLLDYFAEYKLVSKRVPFALWEGRVSSKGLQSPPDKWGRSVTFALKPPKNLTEYNHNENSSHDSSKITNEDSSRAADLLEDYIDSHFVDRCDQKYHHDRSRKPVAVIRETSNYHFDNYESNGAYIQSALL